MNKEPIPMDCNNFNVQKCSHRNKELMKEYIASTRSMPDIIVDVTEGFSMATKVYETFCENCKEKDPKDDQAINE